MHRHTGGGHGLRDRLDGDDVNDGDDGRLATIDVDFASSGGEVASQGGPRKAAGLRQHTTSSPQL